MLSELELAPASEPLSQDQQQQFTEAHARVRPLRKVARMANFNGWVTAVIAAAAVPFAVGGAAEMLVVLGLVVVAVNEFRGRRLVLGLDPRAGNLLGWNQVGFLTLIVVYSLWMIYSGITGPSELDRQMREHPELVQFFGSHEELVRLERLTIFAVYGLTIALSTVFQGLCARYYFRSARRLAAHLEQTPGWILDLQRSTAS